MGSEEACRFSRSHGLKLKLPIAWGQMLSPFTSVNSWGSWQQSTGRQSTRVEINSHIWLVIQSLSFLSPHLHCFLFLTLSCLCTRHHCCGQTMAALRACFPQFPGLCPVNYVLGQNTMESGAFGTGGRKQSTCNLREHTYFSSRPHLGNFPEPLKMEPLAEG